MKKKINNVLNKLVKFNLIYLFVVIIIIIIIYKFYRYEIENFKALDDNPEIIFYTFGNEYKKFKTLENSARNNNINIYIEGIGVKWIDFSTKLKHFHKFIKTVDDKKIIMCLDGFDVIIFDNAENMLKKFKEFDKPLVFSTEQYCGPDPKVSKYYSNDTKDEMYRYLNAGTYMGYAWKIKEMLNEIEKNENYHCTTYNTDTKHAKADDQRCLQKYYLSHTNDIALDHKQKIWSCAFGRNRDDYDFDLNTFSNLYNKTTNNKSSILHTNGWHKWYEDLYK